MWESWFLRRLTVLSSVTVLLVLFACAFLLVSRSPCLGVADNLDFWRVMRPAGIEHVTPVDRPGAFVRCTFRVGPTALTYGGSSSALVAWASRSLWWAFSPAGGLMDLRQVGLLYLILFAAVIFGALASGVRPLIVVLTAAVIIDPGYLLFFNSFYADPALFVALVGITFWMTRWVGRPTAPFGDSWAGWATRSVPLVLLTALGSTSKMLYSTLGVVVATTLLVPTLCVARRDQFRSLMLAGALLGVGIASPWHFSRGSGPDFPEVNAYHAVFAGIMKVTDEPDRVLAALGIPQQYADMPRQDIFSAEIPRQHPVFGELTQLSRLRLACLYLVEPQAMLRVFREVMSELEPPVPHRRGNFTKSPIHPDRAQYQPAFSFARVRYAVVRRIPVLLWLTPVCAFIWVVLSAFRHRWDGETTALLLLVFWFWSQILVVVLGDGLVSLRQHLLGARLAFDLQAVVLLHVFFSKLKTWWPRVLRLPTKKSGPWEAKGEAGDSVQ